MRTLKELVKNQPLMIGLEVLFVVAGILFLQAPSFVTFWGVFSAGVGVVSLFAPSKDAAGWIGGVWLVATLIVFVIHLLSAEGHLPKSGPESVLIILCTAQIIAIRVLRKEQ